MRIKKREFEKMRISKILLSGFRNVKKVQLAIDDFISLVSLNSYGKSNVLNGIDFGMQFITAPPQIKESMMRNPFCIPITIDNQNQNYSIDITFETLIGQINYIINYSFCFSWLKKDNEPKIVSENLKIKTLEKGQKFNKIISREREKCLYKTSEQGRCSSIININDNDLIVNKLLAYDDYYFLDVIKAVNSLKMHIERHLDTSSSYEINPILVKNQKPLSLKDEESVPRLIYSLKKEYPDKYELLIDSYKLLFPDFLEIDVKEIDISEKISFNSDNINLENAPFIIDNKIYSLYVVDKRLNQSLNFEYLSDGAKRVFLLLAYAIIADISGISILVIEEPENSVHPSLLKSYIELLNDISGTCSIIIASHSPYVVQYLNPSNVYIGIPNNDGIAKFNKISSKAVKKLYQDTSKFSNSFGDYIFNLLSGSQDSIDILNSYLEFQEEINE